MDHRCGKRYVLSLDADIKTINGRFDNSKTRDISVGGMSIENDIRQLHMNEVLHIKLTFGDNTRQQYKLKGMVVHLSDDLAGIMFLRDYSVYVNQMLSKTNAKANSKQNQSIQYADQVMTFPPLKIKDMA